MNTALSIIVQTDEKCAKLNKKTTIQLLETGFDTNNALRGSLAM
jgi:hypothetical protein